MPDQSKKRRHHLQFSLRTLLILVTLAVGLLVAWRMYVEPYRQQRETMKLIEELGGTYKTEAADKWLRWVFGDDFQNIVLVDLADCDEPVKYLDPIAALPRLETLVVGGRGFDDEHLAQLKGLVTLRGLILDSTSVTSGGIASFQPALPDVVVYMSQRRSMAAIQRLGKEVGSESDDVHSQIRRPDLKKYFQNVTHISFFNSGKLSDAGLAHLKGLTSLEFLDLGHTQVSDAGLAHLKGLADLSRLDLEGTRVSDAGLSHLNGLTNLQGLGLDGTRVGDAGLAHLKGLTNLDALDLNGTKVSDAGLAHLRGFTNLRVLDLEGTQVSDAGLVQLKGLTNLGGLYLAGTQVTDAGLAHIKGLTNLGTLDLDGTQVSDSGLAHIKGLTNLGTLDLGGTQVSDSGLAHLIGLTNLEVLVLCDTQVSDSGLAHLKALTKLVVLFLGGTQVNDAGAENLRKALPDCEIRR